MTYFSKPNFVPYDEWFDENIDPLSLKFINETEFSNSIHEDFYKMSASNLIIGSSENFSKNNF